jgi:small multidrug resistance pump
MPAAFGLLMMAIAVEVAATAALPKAEGFKDPLWSTGIVAAYAFSIWLLAIVVKDLPVSIAYAIWSGLGTAIVAVIGATFLGESWDPVKFAALGMIIAGVVVLNLQGAH